MLRRSSIRLPDYDYRQDGVYFVTVCCQNHVCTFGEVVGGEMRLNRWGEMVETCWKAIPQHFVGVELDEFVIMPNHVHGIAVINRWEQEYQEKRNVAVHDHTGLNVGAQHAAPLHTARIDLAKTNRPNVAPGSLGAIVRSFKSAATKRINEQRGTAGATIWQRNYYEHIIRDEKSLNSTRLYIQINPAQWDADMENPANAKA